MIPALIARGWKIFPVSKTKRPLAQWRDWATNDIKLITAEFAGRDINIGIACGESGLFVLDDDDGGAVVRLFNDHGSAAPDTYRVKTARGWHYYFNGHADIGNRNPLKERGYKIDVRGNGGFVVAAGSIHESGHIYRAADPDALVVDAPGWLLAILRSSSSNGKAGERVDLGVFEEERRYTLQQAKTHVRPHLERLRDAQDGEINMRLNDAAKTLSHFGEDFWSRGQAEASLLAAQLRPHHDADKAAASGTIASAYRSAAKDWMAVLVPEMAEEGDDTEEAPAPFLVDLGPVLDGSIKRQEPSVGIELPDKHKMLYAGKSHSLIGETETGKSWLALMCCQAEMDAGRHVVYIHFEESDPSGTIERLWLLGVDTEMIRERFHFAGPENRITTAAIEEAKAFSPSLVIIDGVNDGMALHGHGIYEPDGVSLFRRRIVRPFTKIEAAVLELDHVTKNADTRGRDAFGSVHKGNNIDGARFALETVQPFGRGRNGESRLYVTKDRPGFLREHGRPDRRIPGKTWIGRLEVIADADLVKASSTVKATVIAVPPEDPLGSDDEASKFADAVFDAVLAKETSGQDTKLGSIHRAVKRRNDDITMELERQVKTGRLKEIREGNARVFKSCPSPGTNDLSEALVPVPVP